MIAALDVCYAASRAIAACVLFAHWSDAVPARELTRALDNVAEYEPGHFYRRELPCLLAVLHDVGDVPEVVIIDGYVWLDDAGRRGLGAHLHDALGGRAVVIGVAKTRFAGAPAVELLRGRSRNPLFITAAGVDATEAARHIASMHGEHRIPTLLRRADQLCRS